MVSIGFISITTVIFGIGALLLASRARRRLTQGSLRRYIDNYSVCLAFMVIFSLWVTIRSMTDIEISFSGFAGYPEFIFVVFAYIGFIIASYRVSKISEEFGFKDDGKEIANLIDKKKK
jgi:cytochrome bd-type quinol oxidase subunit 2